MKRLLAPGALALLLLAAATFVFAQSSGQGTLRTPSGTKTFTWLVQGGHTYVSADDVVAGLGGKLEQDSNGYRMTVGEAVAAFGPDSRYGVVRDDLIEMPVAPVLVEGRPFVPWQLFHGFLSRTASLEAVWDAAAHTLTVRTPQADAIGTQVSVTDLQGITKVVVTLSRKAEYGIVKQPGVYGIRFKGTLQAPFDQQSYEDPQVTKVWFAGNEIRIQLSSPEVVGDAYELENPPRIVIDFRKGAAPVPGVAPATPMTPAHSPGIRTIVIDPGHGGKEVGAVGPGGMLEKDLTLALSRRLASSLAAKTGARVILTRDDDSLVSLDQRTGIANQYGADLFLSVHLNAAVGRDARGSETYFLSLEASDELARSAAETENASSGGAASDLDLILWDLAQQSYLDESSRFAQAIQEELNVATGVANRGVKQAPFRVLIGATMPAALVEVGFISNAEEAARLQSEEFQSKMVEAITRAVQRYKSDYEVRIGVAPKPVPPAAPGTTTAPTITAAPASPAPAAGANEKRPQ